MFQEWLFNNFNIIWGLLTVLLSGAFSFRISRRTQGIDVLLAMYKNIFHPIYLIVEDDIHGFNSNSKEYTVAFRDFWVKQNSIHKVLDSSEGFYSNNLRTIFNELEHDNYYDFCRYIDKNHSDCMRLLQIYEPFPYHGKHLRRVMVISAVSFFICTMAYIGVYLAAQANNVAWLLICSVVLLVSIFLLILTRKVYF